MLDALLEATVEADHVVDVALALFSAVCHGGFASDVLLGGEHGRSFEVGVHLVSSCLFLLSELSQIFDGFGQLIIEFFKTDVFLLVQLVDVNQEL